jgi:cellular nucleic acid-binding protein
MARLNIYLYRMVFIYVLQLEDNKYYIGKTHNPRFRLENHFKSSGSEWTKMYKPLKVLEIKSDCDDYDEDKITLQYMDKYGINNVRGGSFVSIKLEKSTISTLKQMSNGTNNKCFICGKEGHFAKDCEEEYEYEYIWVCEHVKYCNLVNKKIPYKYSYSHYDSDSNSDSDSDYDDNECCFRCGREGHYSSSCYATKHIKGYYLH